MCLKTLKYASLNSSESFDSTPPSGSEKITITEKSDGKRGILKGRKVGGRSRRSRTRRKGRMLGIIAREMKARREGRKEVVEKEKEKKEGEEEGERERKRLTSSLCRLNLLLCKLPHNR
jgi:hypothetical protein